MERNVKVDKIGELVEAINALTSVIAHSKGYECESVAKKETKAMSKDFEEAIDEKLAKDFEYESSKKTEEDFTQSLSREMVRQATKVAVNKNKSEVVYILSKYGTKSVATLEEDKFDEYCEELKKIK